MKGRKWLIPLLTFTFLFVFCGTLACKALVIPPEPESQIAEMVPDDFVYGTPRSSGWKKVRAEYIQQHPECEACGSIEKLNVHHIKPFHEHPELELDVENLITFCRKCHFWLGHKGNWSDSNPNCREDAYKVLKKKYPFRR